MQFSLRTLTASTTAIAVLLGAYLYVERTREIDELVGLGFWKQFSLDIALMPVSALCVTVVYANVRKDFGHRPKGLRPLALLAPLVAGLNAVIGGSPPSGVVRVIDIYRSAFYYRELHSITILGHITLSLVSWGIALLIYSRVVATEALDVQIKSQR